MISQELTIVHQIDHPIRRRHDFASLLSTVQFNQIKPDTMFFCYPRQFLQLIVRLSHCLVKLVPVSNSAGYARHGGLVKNQYHKRLVWNPVPLTREAVA